MIFDAENREDGWFRDRIFDVCVVGSGPAGITLSRALARHGRNVGLFEGAGETLTTESQELYAGDVIGVNYNPLDAARLRFFGGTSNHWAGMCRSLDASDFVPHSANPHSGWPIAKSDLDPYAAETDEILDLPPLGSPPDVDLAPLEPIVFRFSSPTRFRKKYVDELTQSARIRMYVNANLVEIGLDGARRSVTELRFKSFKREGSFAVRARHYVLCLGGIENARMLLNSHGDAQYAIGNEYGLVGRYFCEHLHFTLGEVLLKERLPGVHFIGPKPEFMDRAEILNFGLRLHQPPAPPKSYARAVGCSTDFTRKLAEKIGARLDCNPLAVLRIASEQALNPESRVVLSDKTDRFGLRRVALDWRLSEVDLATIRTAAVTCGRVFAERDLGRAKLRDWVLAEPMKLPPLGQEEFLGNHHMCTTRMSADPTQGVVDAHCRLHTVENLYLGGSSVFATAGHANPTYTIVQLALRLADHLDGRLG